MLTGKCAAIVLCGYRLAEIVGRILYPTRDVSKKILSELEANEQIRGSWESGAHVRASVGPAGRQGERP